MDYQPVVLKNIMANLTGNNGFDKSDLDEGLVRHMVLNSLRFINQKFKNEYGEMVIACDSKNYWRKKIFPYYKASRKQLIDDSFVDWEALFEWMNVIKAELKVVLPYRMLEVDTAEADDIIAFLTEMFRIHEKIMIVSGDKDFIQLHGDNVKQYDPIKRKNVDSQKDFLFRHIMEGDQGDGIPNFLSDDDTFVDPTKRQRPLTQKRIEAWYSGTLKIDGLTYEDLVRNYKRNEQLISLTEVPKDIKMKIKEEFENSESKDRKLLFKYLMEKNCKKLLESVNDF